MIIILFYLEFPSKQIKLSHMRQNFKMKTPKRTIISQALYLQLPSPSLCLSQMTLPCQAVYFEISITQDYIQTAQV